MIARNDTFDAIKALAIWLVILGHCIQYLCGLDYWNDHAFQFIYSFHMPLFFMISGFFFASSFKLMPSKFLIKKAVSLLLPCFSWGFIMACLNFESWSSFLLDVFTPSHWPFWFFKGLFLTQLIAYISMRIAMRIGGGGVRVFVFAIVGSFVVYLLPYMAVPRVMIPIFWAGYIMNVYYEKFLKFNRAIGMIAVIVFFGLYTFWNENTMHYSASASVTIYHVVLGMHGYTMMNLLLLLYRIILGIAGSVVIISLLHEFKNINKFVRVIGASTAGIYVLQTFIIERGLRFIFEKYININALPYPCSCVLMLLISVILVIAINWLYQLIKRNSYIDFVFFGHGKLTKVINP